MRLSVPVLSLMLVAVIFSGCISPLGGGATQSDALVRIVRFTFDDETLESLERVDDPDEFFQAVSATFFRYTHDGEDVQAGDVLATFVDRSGRDVERPLSDFTNAGTLSAGDQVTITGAAPYSTMALRSGDEVIAERRHVVADWFHAGGMPLPLAAPQGSSAAWRATGDAGLDVSFARASYDWAEDDAYVSCEGECEPRQASHREGIILEDVHFDLEAQAWGDFAMAALAVDGQTHVDMELDGHFGVGSSLDGFVQMFRDREDNVSAEDSGGFGYEVNASAEGEGLVRMIFDASGALTATGGEGSYATAANARSWAPGMDGSEIFDEEMPAGSSAYREYPFHSGEPVPGLVANLVADIYGMTLVPGDSFEIVAMYAEDDVDVDASLEILVAAREDKAVTAGTIPTLRIETSISFEATPTGSSPNSMSIQGLTHWIHADTYLPVLIQQQTPADWPSDEDLQELFDVISEFASDEGQGSNVTMPTGLHTSIQAQGTLELTTLIGKVRVPAVASLMGMWGMWGLPASFMLMGLGAQGYAAERPPDWDEPMARPGLSFMADGDQLDVVRTDGASTWGDLRVSLEGPCTASLLREGSGTPIENGGQAGPHDAIIMAGDAVLVERAGACTANIIHDPSNTLLGSWYLDG